MPKRNLQAELVKAHMAQEVAKARKPYADKINELKARIKELEGELAWIREAVQQGYSARYILTKGA